MKIEMTGPVHISPAPDAKGYKVAFFVPSRSELMHQTLLSNLANTVTKIAGSCTQNKSFFFMPLSLFHGLQPMPI
jgi:hypothetical protein